MRWAGFLLGFFVLLVVAFLIIYFFIPFNVTEFNPGTPINSNFSLNSDLSGIQFYPNMRYQDEVIDYKIDNACTLQKRNDMTEAFNIISNLTVLSFEEVTYGEELSVTCSDEDIVSGNTFVAGEGGVTNVTVAGDYHVVFQGKILLIRDSNCQRPNVAIHELLHSLGFNHSLNPYNIMYETMDCDQTIGEDIPNLINELYSVPDNSDLTFEEVSAFMSGKYLNANISVRNEGFGNAPSSKIVIYADDKVIKEFELKEIDIGFGRKVSLSNLWINQLSVDNIKFEIVSDFEELDKSNNVYTLYVNN